MLVLDIFLKEQNVWVSLKKKKKEMKIDSHLKIIFIDKI